MFFNRNKPQEQIGLTDGIEDKVSDFVKDWGTLQRGQREFAADSQEPPLQLLTDADVAFFLKAMEDEAAKIETEIQDVRRQRNAEIAQKDAQIAALNREIENTKAKIQSQSDEIIRRGHSLFLLHQVVNKIDPTFDAGDTVDEGAIRREVVRRKFGDASVADRSEAYIDERFELLAGRASADPFALVVADGIVATGGSLDALRRGAEDAYTKCVDDLRNAHKRRD